MRSSILLAAVLSVVASSAHAQTPTGSVPPPLPPRACLTSGEAHKFDFWIGEWDVTPWQVRAPTPAQQAGTSSVYSILSHCVISENWKGARGIEGKSYNFYDPNVKHWRQVWISETGGVLDYTGDFSDGAMRFLGWTLNPKGDRVEQRLTFFAIAKDTVRQLFETSSDGGKTWTPGFDGRYVRHH